MNPELWNLNPQPSTLKAKPEAPNVSLNLVSKKVFETPFG
jgi:hypothetical protein